jgi:hypothetical protein
MVALPELTLQGAQIIADMNGAWRQTHPNVVLAAPKHLPQLDLVQAVARSKMKRGEAMGLSSILFPKFFEPIAHTLAIIISFTVLSDWALSTSFTKPLFFCYAISGLYVLSVVMELIYSFSKKDGTVG